MKHVKSIIKEKEYKNFCPKCGKNLILEPQNEVQTKVHNFIVVVVTLVAHTHHQVSNKLLERNQG